jgi:uncharacterized protein YkwD
VTAAERAYATAINDVRTAHGLDTLTEDPALVESSRRHSADMHRQTMLDPHLQHLGVGISTEPFRGWRTAVIVTTDFDG